MGAHYSTQWFTACKINDSATVKKMFNYFLGKRDKKNIIDDTQPRFQGFTGLLYACYSNSIDIVQILLPYEHMMFYESDYDVSISIYRPQKLDNYIICQGTSCLQLAILRSNFEVAHYILVTMTGNPQTYKTLYAHSDQNDCTALDLLVQQNYEAGFTMFRFFKDYFLNMELLQQRRSELNPVVFATFFDNQNFLKCFLSLTSDKKYGQTLNQYFKQLNINQLAQLQTRYPEGSLGNQQAINANFTQIRLMQAGEAPPPPQWLAASPSVATSSSVYRGSYLATLQSSIQTRQTITLKQAIKPAFSITSMSNITDLASKHVTAQLTTSVQPSVKSTSAREVQVTPQKKPRYELFTDVYASPHSQSLSNFRNKYVTIIDDEYSDEKKTQKQDVKQHNLRMCDFHRSYEANSSNFSNTQENSQELVLQDD